jgi:hypothetical protein
LLSRALSVFTHEKSHSKKMESQHQQTNKNQRINFSCMTAIQQVTKSKIQFKVAQKGKCWLAP